MRKQSPGFSTCALSRMISKQIFSEAAMTFSPCDVGVPFLRMSRETAKESSSISPRVWYNVGKMRRGRAAAVK